MGSPAPLTAPAQHHLILFDGVCNLCNGAVSFVIRRDKNHKFKFAPLQSKVGRQYLERLPGMAGDLYSMILVKNNKVFDRSDAVLEIARDLSGFWPALYLFKVLPRFIRNAGYGFIARNRYRFFGRKNECMVPTPELKARFIEE
jgi:predicted DCC family thiol-disulfide oxidoreductase YuxK